MVGQNAAISPDVRKRIASALQLINSHALPGDHAVLMNNHEEAMAKQAGGLGTINAFSGLRQYGLDGGGPDGPGGNGGPTGGDHNGPDHSGPPISGGGPHSPGGAGGGVKGPGDHSHDNAGNAGPAGPGTASISNPIHFGPNIDAANKAFADDIAGSLNDPHARPGSYGGPQSPASRIGYGALNILGSPLGIAVHPNMVGTIGPDDTGLTTTHDITSVDPIKAALGIAGLASPIATGLGLAYSGAKALGFKGPTITSGAGLGLGFNGGTLGGLGSSSTSPGTQAIGHQEPDSGGDHLGLFSGNNTKSVGTNAGSGIQQPTNLAQALAQPLYQPHSYPSQSILQQYNGQPFPNYPANIWIGGGTGSL